MRKEDATGNTQAGRVNQTIILYGSHDGGVFWARVSPGDMAWEAYLIWVRFPDGCSAMGSFFSDAWSGL